MKNKNLLWPIAFVVVFCIAASTPIKNLLLQSNMDAGGYDINNVGSVFATTYHGDGSLLSGVTATLPVASTTVLGGVILDGTTIVIDPTTHIISAVGGGGGGGGDVYSNSFPTFLGLATTGATALWATNAGTTDVFQLVESGGWSFLVSGADNTLAFSTDGGYRMYIHHDSMAIYDNTGAHINLNKSGATNVFSASGSGATFEFDPVLASPEIHSGDFIGNGAGLVGVPATATNSITALVTAGVIDMSKLYESYLTNATFTLAPPINVSAGLENESVLDVTNSSGSLIVIAAPASWHVQGTQNCTNKTIVSLYIVPGETNAIFYPKW